MKKILSLLTILVLAFLVQPAFAAPHFLSKSVPIEAITGFDTDNPAKTFDGKILEERELADATVLKEGDIVHFEVVEVKDPKRLKQNAKFKLKAIYYIDTTGKKHEFEHETFAKYTTVLDKKDLAKNAALGVGNYFVKGLSIGVAAVEGVVKNEEDNRVKSSVVSVYKASPLSYVEKGQALKFERGDSFLLKFNTSGYDEEDEEDAPNYDYTINDEDEGNSKKEN